MLRDSRILHYDSFELLCCKLAKAFEVSTVFRLPLASATTATWECSLVTHREGLGFRI